jgi:signal transduction histidine kinase
MAERTRIAREMHDVVAHGLSVMIVQADGARYAAAANPTAVGPALETIATTGRESLAEMRQLLGLLREDADSGTRPLPGLPEIPWLLAQAEASGTPVTADLPDPLPAVSGTVGLACYRLVQEALTNVRKHAGPHARVDVRLWVEDGRLHLLLIDTGRGAAAAGDGQGHGLIGMRERIHAVGGEFSAGPRRGGGFEVTAQIPLGEKVL